jgi:hypothetical protein
MEQSSNEKKDTKTWLKRLGWAGIIFFVVKGCITLSLIVFGGQALFKSCG